MPEFSIKLNFAIHLEFAVKCIGIFMPRIVVWAVAERERAQDRCGQINTRAQATDPPQTMSLGEPVLERITGKSTILQRRTEDFRSRRD